MSFSIGAAVTHAAAARSPAVWQAYGALAETFRKVATPRIRNVGTVGGNLANGDPHQDPPVALLALDARVTAVSARGQREIRLRELFRSYYETALRPDEILTRVYVPIRPARAGLAFIKYLPRSQDDYATVDVAAWVRLAEGESGDPGPVLEEVRIALGSVGPVAFRALDAERILTGAPLADGVLVESGAVAAAACDPEDDVRGSPAYKRELVRVLVGRAVRQAVEDARR
jgi:carbon-monoxide dehydrogenase medium subunit